MDRNMQKGTGLIILVIAILVFIANTFNFLLHADFFLNKQQTDASVNIVSYSPDGDGMTLNVQYMNDYDQAVQTHTLIVGLRAAKEIFGDRKDITLVVFYTKWFNQVFLKDVQFPAPSIFILDIVGYILIYFGVRAGWEKLKL